MQAGARADLKPLTSLRGLAAIMVVVYHYTGGFLPAINLGEVTGIVSRGYLFVDLFFVLSGFVMAHAYGETFRHTVSGPAFLSFMKARFARVYPLHFVILFGFLALEMAKFAFHRLDWGLDVGEAFDPGATAYGFVLNLLLLQTSGLLSHPQWNGPAWSIGAEFLVYLVFPGLSLLILRLRVAGRLAIAVLAIAGLCLISKGGWNLDVSADYGALRCGFEFTLGLLVYRVFAWGRPGLAARTAPLLALAALILVGLHFEVPDVWIPIGFAGLVLLAAANQGAGAQVLSARPLVWLGEISYSVYMSHYLLLEVVEFASRAATGRRIGEGLGLGSSLVVFCAMTAAVTVLSVLLYRGVEVPARRILRGQSRDRRYIEPEPAVM